MNWTHRAARDRARLSSPWRSWSSACCAATTRSCSPACSTLGGFLLAGLLVLTAGRGVGYHGQFVADAFSSFVKMLMLAGAALALILSLDYNRKNTSRASSSRC